MHRLVIALVTLIGLVGAAVVAGYFFLFASSVDRAATLAPANTALYANVYLQPSPQQQMNLSGLIGRLPGFADDAALDEKIDQVVQNLLGETGIDYRTQLKPWLGDQIAIAAWPGADDPALGDAVVLAEVTDLEAATAAIAEITSEQGGGFEVQTYQGVDLRVGEGAAYAFIDDMLIIGSAAEALHAVVDVGDGADALAARSDFRSAMERVPADHLASIFVDLAAIAEASGVADEFGSVTTLSATLVAERDGLRLSGSAPFDLAEAAPSARDGFALGGEPSSLVDWMPEDTLAEIVVFGLRQTLEDAEAAAGAAPQGEEITSALDTLRAIAAFGLGIDLDADILPLLDREVALAITGFDGTLPSGQLLLRPDDATAAADALERIATSLGRVGATVTRQTVEGTDVVVVDLPDVGEVAYAIADGIVIIGLGSDDVLAAVDAHASGASLGSSERYATTFEVAGTRGGNEAWVDIGAVVDLLGTSVDLPDDARDILSQIGTFGLTAPSRDDQIEFHAVLTVDER